MTFDAILLIYIVDLVNHLFNENIIFKNITAFVELLRFYKIGSGPGKLYPNLDKWQSGSIFFIFFGR